MTNIHLKNGSRPYLHWWSALLFLGSWISGFFIIVTDAWMQRVPRRHGRFESEPSAHGTYLRTFLEDGQLRAAGPFADDAGALWVLDADNAEAAEEIVKGDPLVDAGVITS